MTAPLPLIDKTRSQSGETLKEANTSALAAQLTKYYNAIMYMRGFYLIFQGFFAGFALTIVYSQETFNTDSKLLEVYQINAQEFRRFFYILSIIALVGSGDLLLTMINSNKKRKQVLLKKANKQIDHYRQMMVSMHSGKLLDDNKEESANLILAVIIFTFYVVAYLCTVGMSQQDVFIATKNGWYASYEYSDPYLWSTAALDDNKFRDGFSNWKVLNRVRFLSTVLAWMGCCMLLCVDLGKMNSRGEELYRIQKIGSAWLARAQQMEGKSSNGFENLSADEIAKLVEILETGLQRAKEALAYTEEDVA